MDSSNFLPLRSRSGDGGARLDLEGRMKHLRKDQMTRTESKTQRIQESEKKKKDHPQECGWASPNQVKALICVTNKLYFGFLIQILNFETLKFCIIVVGLFQLINQSEKINVLL